MIKMFRLHNQIKQYEWGSPYHIPRLLGVPAGVEPCAELWMGCHPGAPSQVSLPADMASGQAGTGSMSLGDLIAGNPLQYLGEKAANEYGTLPFLFKLLAAEKPLSIQVHPNLEQAREGFDRENKAGLPLDAPNRNYKDPNHKPEIICALTPFTGMCGFRSRNEIQQLLAVFLNLLPPDLRECLNPLVQALAASQSDAAQPDAMRNFLKALFNLSPAVRQALTESILSAGNPVGAENIEWALMQDFARLYPGDPAVIAPLYLNVFRLEPGEAIFLKAGILHAYIKGFGVELMASSDNVLRGGLTGKYVDIEELIKVLDCSPMKPDIIKPEPGFSQFTYPVSCKEFSLTVIRNDTASSLPMFPVNGPAICIVTEGEAVIGDMVLKQGESAFIPPQNNGKNPVLHGHFTVYAASFPGENSR